MTGTQNHATPAAARVVITGACGNLGRAVAKRFAADGALLVLLDRDAGPLQALRATDHRRQLTLAADLTDAAAVATAIDAAVRDFGGIDVLCNLAGGFQMGPAVHETTDASWDFLMDLNVRSLLHTARAVVPHMLRHGQGHIVHVGAAAALRGGAGMGAYAASKSAVARITESMSAELRDAGIHVNCVQPSILDTPENRAAMPKADASRWVAPQDLAEVVAFLCSPQARSVHGACIPVMGRC